jgi:hypothetical protein
MASPLLLVGAKRSITAILLAFDDLRVRGFGARPIDGRPRVGFGRRNEKFWVNRRSAIASDFMQAHFLLKS